MEEIKKCKSKQFSRKYIEARHLKYLFGLLFCMDVKLDSSQKKIGNLNAMDM